MVARLPDGTQPTRVEPMALDLAVVNALGAGHWDETLRGPGSAAGAYSVHKCRHQRTEELCRAAGVRFQPLVWEAQGGSTPATRAFLHRLAGAVAVVESGSPEAVRTRLLQQIAVVLANGAGRALHRRRVAPASKRCSLSAAAADLQVEA